MSVPHNTVPAKPNFQHALDLLDAIRTLKALEAAKREPSAVERGILSQFCGFGRLALDLFPHPVTGQYKTQSWAHQGSVLQDLLTKDEYASAARSTFTAFFTSPVVMKALYSALWHFDVPTDATVLEPGCGVGNFLALAPPAMRFVGIEMDSLSSRIARLLFPQHSIRTENIRDSQLAPESVDVALGNPPFGDVSTDYWSMALSLHELCIAKAIDTLKPGGVLAMVVTHSLLDKLNPAFREQLESRTELLGAIRLPAEAFAGEGTKVVTDLLFLFKRYSISPSFELPSWCFTSPLTIDGVEVTVNSFFLQHPEMVLGSWTREDRLYGREDGYSIKSNGDLESQLATAIALLPARAFCAQQPSSEESLRHPIIAADSTMAEGSFFINDQQQICQVQFRKAVPVLHGNKPLTATKGLIGQRLAALIGLRDAAREVLLAQQEKRSRVARYVAREALNAIYDAFVAEYGPINKVTVSAAEDGSVTRRLPNLVKFRDDPDAMLVMALEEYDEETGEATKAAIFSEDVVGHCDPVTTVQSAEEGLLVVLNELGRVDLPAISQLYGQDEATVLAELSDLLFHDPVSQEWVTADTYLSGNVREKLRQAVSAGDAYVRNVAALVQVQPDDILPGEIDANLGAPWIPAEDIRAFALHLFEVQPYHIDVAYSPTEATWVVEGSRWVRSVALATVDYGTARVEGITLLHLALNLRVPTVYDTIPLGDKDEQRLNEAETLAAREKQERIKSSFKEWIFKDMARTERLVRIYNDTYNNIRLRHFDGSHLTFPGMTTQITLYQHQKDAIWRIMSSGNTLLAHAVGLGKTNCLMAAGMKMKQAGLIRKPLYAVVNHMLEQFSRECRQLYPNAKLLMATKEDFSKDRRKLLTAKIASNNWDGIITTHSSFERIGMSAAFQQSFLQERIDAYEELLVEYEKRIGNSNKAQRNIRKQLEKQKARYEAKLEALSTEDKKDDGLVFEELGVDYLFIDECFVYDTLVITNIGLRKIGEIVEKRLNVSVLSYNSYILTLEWKPIVDWFANTRRHPLVKVTHEHGSFVCTSKHKVWVKNQGYKEVSQLCQADTLYAMRQDIHPEIPCNQKQPCEVLLSSMSQEKSDSNQELSEVSSGIHISFQGRGVRDEKTKALLQRALQNGSSAHESRIRAQAQNIFQTTFCEQPASIGRQIECHPAQLAEQCHARRNSECTRQEHRNESFHEKETAEAGRKWTSSPDSTDASRNAVGASNRICDLHKADMEFYPKPSEQLQDRHCRPGAKNCYRGGRTHTPCEENKGEGCQERSGIVASRVVSVEIFKQGSDEGYCPRDRDYQTVYDIEVDDNHNYFANGVLVSNCNAHKNLETPSKMERVAGLQNGGSQRAFDLAMKAHYLHQQRPGHGITFATGTPISNTMVELYTLQRYLDPEGLAERGLGHFDAWAATFGEIVTAMEISPDGKTLRPRSRFGKFVNLPELQQMFRLFADVKTAGQVTLDVPGLIGGKAETIACPMSPEQYAMQELLVERYQKIRDGKVKPWEDNALAVTTDGRKLALDGQLLSPTATDWPASKLNALIANVYRIWEKTQAERATQLIFADLGVHNTTWGFSLYETIVDKLQKQGIPPGEIAMVGDADTDSKKHRLFEQVRQGSVRVLLGSTAKMGLGTNVQTKLLALHHLDAPWKPSEVEQRDGRILRQKNSHKAVHIYRYVTEGSFDAFMWQALETKARFIAQVINGSSTARQADDVDGQVLSYAQVKAIASGNPAMLTLAEVEADVQRMTLLRQHHANAQFSARKYLQTAEAEKKRLRVELDGCLADIETLAIPDAAPYLIKEERYSREDAEKVLGQRMHDILSYGEHRRIAEILLGEWHGLAFGICSFGADRPGVYLRGRTVLRTDIDRRYKGGKGILHALDILRADHTKREALQYQVATFEQRKHAWEMQLITPFLYESSLLALTGLRDELQTALGKKPSADGRGVEEIVAAIATVYATTTLEAAEAASIERTPGQTAGMTEASTTTALRRIAERANVPPLEEPAEEVIVLPIEPIIIPAPRAKLAEQLSLF